MLDSIAAALGVKKAALIAGFIGAALSAAMGPKRTRIERTFTFLCGFGFAIYLTAPLIQFFKLEAGAYEGGIGFVLGLFGMTISDAIYKFIKETNWSDILKLGR